LHSTLAIDPPGAADTASGNFTLTTSCTAAQTTARQLSLVPAITCGSSTTDTTVGGTDMMTGGISFFFVCLFGSIVGFVGLLSSFCLTDFFNQRLCF
jgi:hypothetical protein